MFSIKNGILYVAFNIKKELFNAEIFEDNARVYKRDYYTIKMLKNVNSYIVEKVLQQ